MSHLEKSEYVWPPQGWAQLEKIAQLSGQTIVKDAYHGTISGFSYHIEPTPIIAKDNQQRYLYHFQIDGWEYDINNASREYPILSFTLKERDVGGEVALSLSHIRIKARPFIKTKLSAHRLFKAALFFIQKINDNETIHYLSILEQFKIHPKQKYLYHKKEMSPCPVTKIFMSLFDKADNNNAAS